MTKQSSYIPWFIKLTTNCGTRSSTRQTRIYYHLLQRFSGGYWRLCGNGFLAKMIGVVSSQYLANARTLGEGRFRFPIYRSCRCQSAIICLTDRGQNIFHHSKAKFVEKLAGPLGYLAPEEQQFLLVLMEKLAKHFPQQKNDWRHPERQRNPGSIKLIAGIDCNAI